MAESSTTDDSIAILLVDCPDCDQFAGRALDLCLARGREGRSNPNQPEVDAFRELHGIRCNVEPIPTDHRKFSGRSVAKQSLVNGAKIGAEKKPPKPPRPPGVGDHLAEIFRLLGVANCIPGCEGCSGAKARMNAAGVDGCKARRDEFVADLRERANDVKALKWITAAANAALHGLTWLVTTDPVAACFDEAVRRAEKQQEPTP